MEDRPDVNALKDEIDQGAGPASLIQRVGERLGASMNARTVFGDPIKRGEVTVIPVAKAVWGFGAGGGSTAASAIEGEPAESGSGGGGGGLAQPMGYIEVTDRGATYHRIDDPLRRAGAAALTALATGLVVAVRSRKR